MRRLVENNRRVIHPRCERSERPFDDDLPHPPHSDAPELNADIVALADMLIPVTTRESGHHRRDYVLGGAGVR